MATTSINSTDSPQDVTVDKGEATLSVRLDDAETYRREFLSRFSAEDDHRIMRKVDWRFLPLMGFMYLIKQIDFSNAASIKVLQVGEPRNVLTELNMTADQYNWVQTVYYVGAPGNMTRPCNLLILLTDQLCHLRDSQQSLVEEDYTSKISDTNFLHVGYRGSMSCGHSEQGRILRPPFSARSHGSWILSWSRCSDV